MLNRISYNKTELNRSSKRFTVGGQFTDDVEKEERHKQAQTYYKNQMLLFSLSFFLIHVPCYISKPLEPTLDNYIQSWLNPCARFARWQVSLIAPIQKNNKGIAKHIWLIKTDSALSSNEQPLQQIQRNKPSMDPKALIYKYTWLCKAEAFNVVPPQRSEVKWLHCRQRWIHWASRSKLSTKMKRGFSPTSLISVNGPAQTVPALVQTLRGWRMKRIHCASGTNTTGAKLLICVIPSLRPAVELIKQQPNPLPRQAAHLLLSTQLKRV